MGSSPFPGATQPQTSSTKWNGHVYLSFSKKKKQFFQKIKNGIKNLRIDDPDVVALSAYGFYMHTAANTKDPLVRAYYTTLAIDQLNEYLED